MTMNRLLPAALLGLLVLNAGCHLLHRKKAAAPELPPAAGIQVEYHDRWVARKVHDLMAADPTLAEAAAKQMAEADFAKQFPYITIPASAPNR